MRYFFYVALVGALLGSVSPISRAAAKVSQQELEQIHATQTEIQRKLAEAMNLMEQIRQEFQLYKGSIDQGSQLGTRQATDIEDLQAQVRSLEDRLHLMSSQMDEIIQGKLDPKLADKAKAVADAYLLGLDAFNAGNLKNAAQIWQNFIGKNPKSAWVPGALYWIGEVHFQMNEYSQAIQQYQKVIASFPQSSWTRRALFKQGVAFFKLGDYESAIAFFDKVMLDYRKSSEGWRALHYKQEIGDILARQAAAAARPVPEKNE